jgi:hypothetical protein
MNLVAHLLLGLVLIYAPQVVPFHVMNVSQSSK